MLHFEAAMLAVVPDGNFMPICRSFLGLYEMHKRAHPDGGTNVCTLHT
jgi:hypothetical protein